MGSNCIQAAFSGGGGGGASDWELLGSDELTSGGAELSVSGFTAHDVLQVILHMENVTDTTLPMLRINNLEGTAYNVRSLISTSISTRNGKSGWELEAAVDNSAVRYVIYILAPNSNLAFTGAEMFYSGANLDQAAATPATSNTIVGGGNNAQTTAITQVDALWSSGNTLGKLLVFGADLE